MHTPNYTHANYMGPEFVTSLRHNYFFTNLQILAFKYSTFSLQI